MASQIGSLLNRVKAQQEAENQQGNRMNNFGFKGVAFIALALLALLALVTVLGSFYTIDSGKVGVIQTFGRYQEAVSQPGLHWKRPFIDTVLENERISASLTPLLVKQNQVEKWSGQVPTVQSGEGTGLLFNMGEIGK